MGGGLKGNKVALALICFVVIGGGKFPLAILTLKQVKERRQKENIQRRERKDHNTDTSKPSSLSSLRCDMLYKTVFFELMRFFL